MDHIPIVAKMFYIKVGKLLVMGTVLTPGILCGKCFQDKHGGIIAQRETQRGNVSQARQSENSMGSVVCFSIWLEDRVG